MSVNQDTSNFFEHFIITDIGRTCSYTREKVMMESFPDLVDACLALRTPYIRQVFTEFLDVTLSGMFFVAWVDRYTVANPFGSDSKRDPYPSTEHPCMLPRQDLLNWIDAELIFQHLSTERSASLLDYLLEHCSQEVHINESYGDSTTFKTLSIGHQQLRQVVKSLYLSSLSQ